MTFKTILLTFLCTIPVLAYNQISNCGDITAVSDVYMTELEIAPVNVNSDTDATKKSLPRRRSRSLMLQEDGSYPCGPLDFYLKPGRSYEIEFLPIDDNPNDPANNKWTLRIDYNNNESFEANEIYSVEGSGQTVLQFDVPHNLRLKKTWLEFELKRTIPNCGQQYCGLDTDDGYCTIFKSLMDIEVGALCDVQCMPLGNIFEYENIQSMQLSRGLTIIPIASCSGDGISGYCNNFYDIIAMSGDVDNVLIVDVGYACQAQEETVTIWFDTNHDGDFSDEQGAGTSTGSNQLSVDVNLPTFTGSLAFFTMRVKLENGSVSTGPCEEIEGETHDYIVSIEFND